jgi:hypothetical protein
MSAVNDVILDAYREINVVGYDEQMDGPQAVRGLRLLYLMLKQWQAQDHLWFADEMTVTLTTAASYTLAERPVRVFGARRVISGIETPMAPMLRQEYLEMPLKTNTGVPTAFYVDHQRATAVLYVWPVLATADGTTVKLDFEREVTEPELRQGTLDVPSEWHNAVVLSLADRLSVGYEREAAFPNLAGRAAMAKGEVLATDREGSVYLFGGRE